MISFREMYKMLENKGPGRATSSKGTIYKIEARNDSIIAFLESGKGRIYIHDDCWRKSHTCKGTWAGGIYNGRYSIFDWYEEKTNGEINDNGKSRNIVNTTKVEKPKNENARKELIKGWRTCLNKLFEEAEEERQKAIKEKKEHEDYKKISAEEVLEKAEEMKVFDDKTEFHRRTRSITNAMKSIKEDMDEVTYDNLDSLDYTIKYKLPRIKQIETVTDTNRTKNIVKHKSANSNNIKEKNIDLNNIHEVVMDYYNQRNYEHRFSSFDYCYNYFNTTSDLTKDMEKSCLQIGFYLASWGMLRNRDLLQKSSKHYQKLIEYISNLNKDDWKIDVDKYNDESLERLLDIYSNIKTILNGTVTLTTKIMLGVFGSIPAFDRYFKNTFNIISLKDLNKDALDKINNFYNENCKIIDELAKKITVLNFNKENKILISYTKAKIIDMYGFNKGLIIDIIEKKKDGKSWKN